MRRVATAAAGTLATVALAAAPASASVDGWHNGTTAWAGVCLARADLYTVAGYADAWRWQMQWCGDQAQKVHARLTIDGRVRWDNTAWRHPGRIDGAFGGHVYTYRHTARLDVWIVNRGNAHSAAVGRR